MSGWKNEDDIKAELRVLTSELKQLREELRDMVTPHKPNPSRALLHRHSWPPDVRGHTATPPDKTSTRRKRR